MNADTDQFQLDLEIDTS